MRRTWAVLAGALALGLVGGLYYAWVVNPVEYVELGPQYLA